MQELPSELNRRLLRPAMAWALAAGIGFAAAVALAFGVALAQRPFCPSLLECRLGTVPAAARAAAEGPWAAVAVAAAVLLLAALLPWLRRRGDALAWLCLPAAAAGVVLWLGPQGVPPWPLAAMLAVLLPWALPLLRERHWLLLVLAPVLAAWPGAVALQQARVRAQDAEVVARLQALAPRQGDLVLAVGDEVDADTRAGLRAALQPPAFAAGVDVFVVAKASPELEWLRRLDLPGIGFDQGHPVPLPAVPPAARLRAGLLPAQGQVLTDAEGRAVGVQVRGGALAAGAEVAVFLGPGVARSRCDDQGLARLTAATHPEWTAALRTLPSGSPIRVLVVSPTAADAYGWSELKLP